MKKQNQCGEIFPAGRRILKIIYDIIENILVVVLAAIFLLTITAVILRYIFNTSIYGSDEIVGYLFVYLTALGAPLLIQTDGHILVDFFTKAPIKVKKILLAIQYIIVLALNVFLLINSVTWINQVGGFLTPLLHFEQRWGQYAIPACMGLSILYGLSRLVGLFERNDTLRRDLAK